VCASTSRSTSAIHPRSRWLCAPAARQRCGWSAGHSRAPDRRPRSGWRAAEARTPHAAVGSLASGDGCCGIFLMCAGLPFCKADFAADFAFERGAGIKAPHRLPLAARRDGAPYPFSGERRGTVSGTPRALRLCASLPSAFHARVSGSRDWPESQGVIQPIIYRADGTGGGPRKTRNARTGRRRTGWLHGLERVADPSARGLAHSRSWRTSRAHRRPGGVSPHLGGHPWHPRRSLGLNSLVVFGRLQALTTQPGITCGVHSEGSGNEPAL